MWYMWWWLLCAAKGSSVFREKIMKKRKKSETSTLLFPRSFFHCTNDLYYLQPRMYPSSCRCPCLLPPFQSRQILAWAVGRKLYHTGTGAVAWQCTAAVLRARRLVDRAIFAGCGRTGTFIVFLRSPAYYTRYTNDFIPEIIQKHTVSKIIVQTGKNLRTGRRAMLLFSAALPLHFDTTTSIASPRVNWRLFVMLWYLRTK